MCNSICILHFEAAYYSSKSVPRTISPGSVIFPFMLMEHLVYSYITTQSYCVLEGHGVVFLKYFKLYKCRVSAISSMLRCRAVAITRGILRRCASGRKTNLPLPFGAERHPYHLLRGRAYGQLSSSNVLHFKIPGSCCESQVALPPLNLGVVLEPVSSQLPAD